MKNLEKIYYKSKAIGKLSSESLKELKLTLTSISVKKRKLREEISLHERELKRRTQNLGRLDWFPLRVFFRHPINKKKQEIERLREKIFENSREYEKSKLGLEIVLQDQVEAAFGVLEDKFDELKKSQMIWDLTVSKAIDGIKDRTTASNSVERIKIRLTRTGSEKNKL